MADLIVPRVGHSFKNIAGQQFGRLVAIEPIGSVKGSWRWRFRCDCGEEVIRRGDSVANGNTSSCGCIRKPHGMWRSSEYGIWQAMKTRCYNPKATNFADYGGRGITVCDRWRGSFMAFIADMGPRPSPLHTLDRNENSKGYSPDNCRWATGKEQSRNKRNNVFLTFKGRSLTIAAWAEETGISVGRICARLRQGWPVERILTTPSRMQRFSDHSAASPGLS